MKFSNALLAGVAALALISCGKKDNAADGPKSESSQLAANADAGSPLRQLSWWLQGLKKSLC